MIHMSCVWPAYILIYMICVIGVVYRSASGDTQDSVHVILWITLHGIEWQTQWMWLHILYSCT